MEHWRYEGKRRCIGWLDRFISECRYMISSCCYLHHHVYDFSVVLEVSVLVIVVQVT